MFLKISTSEIHMSKDIKIVFIISDKLPFKQIEINILSPTLTWTYLKNGQICNHNGLP